MPGCEIILAVTGSWLISVYMDFVDVVSEAGSLLLDVV